MAKIELKSKPIKRLDKLGEYAPQHLYIVYTKDNGEQIEYRGGTKGGDNVHNWALDNLKIFKMPYDRKHPDADKSNTHISELLIESTEEIAEIFIERMDKTMRWINEGNYDYKLPTAGRWLNSNTAARYLVEEAGFKFKLPKYASGKEVLAPGWDGKMDKTLLDKLMEEGGYQDEFVGLINEINSQEKPKITEEDVSDRLEELNKAGAEAIEIADSVLAADGANNAEKFHNAARGFEGDEPGVASVLHGLGDDTAMVDFLADFALKNYGEESKEISEEGEL